MSMGGTTSCTPPSCVAATSPAIAISAASTEPAARTPTSPIRSSAPPSSRTPATVTSTCGAGIPQRWKSAIGPFGSRSFVAPLAAKTRPSPKAKAVCASDDGDRISCLVVTVVGVIALAPSGMRGPVHPYYTEREFRIPGALDRRAALPSGS
jgi:hypothetical protein